MGAFLRVCRSLLAALVASVGLALALQLLLPPPVPEGAAFAYAGIAAILFGAFGAAGDLMTNHDWEVFYTSSIVGEGAIWRRTDVARREPALERAPLAAFLVGLILLAFGLALAA